MMHDAGHDIEGGNADEEQAVEGSRITPETPSMNNDDSNRSGGQGRPKKKLRRGRPSKFSSNYSWTCDRCGSVLSSQTAVKYHKTQSSCAQKALQPCRTTERFAGSSGSLQHSRRAKEVASKSIRSNKSREGEHEPRTEDSEYEEDYEEEDLCTDMDSVASNGTQSLRRIKRQHIKTPPISTVSGISWRSACPGLRTQIDMDIMEEGRVLPLSLWEFENSGHITLPSAPLHLALSEDQAQAQHRIKAGSKTVEISPFLGIVVERNDTSYSDILCNIGGKVLCAAPLVVSSLHCSAYSVTEESKRIGCCKYLYIAIGMDTPTEVSKLVTSTELPLSSPTFHAFGKAYPGPNLLQLWRISLPWSKKCTGGEVSLSYCICHTGGRVLDVAWAPDSPLPPPADSISEDGQASELPLGLLAAACGDGVVRVFLCPKTPPIIKECENQDGPEVAESSIKVLQKRPAAGVKLQEGILLTCVSWSPHEPMLLACGATDGSVSLWRLQPSTSNGNHKEHYLLTPTPIQILLDISRGVKDPVGTMTRAIEWSPYDKNMLSVVGQRTAGKMWDIREPFFPNSVVSDVFRKEEDAYDICWCPLGLKRVFIAHVGGVKLVSMSGKYCSLIKNKELDVMPDDVAWGVDAVKIGHERLVSVVAALPDGTVRLFQVPIGELHTKTSRRRGGLGYTVVHRITLNRNPQGLDLLDPPLTCHSLIATDKEWEDEEKGNVINSNDKARITVKKSLIPWAEVNTVAQLVRLDGRRTFSPSPIIKQDSANFAVIVGGGSGLLRCFVADEAIFNSI